MGRRGRSLNGNIHSKDEDGVERRRFATPASCSAESIIGMWFGYAIELLRNDVRKRQSSAGRRVKLQGEKEYALHWNRLESVNNLPEHL